jgi:carboxymethylenebutenolidase
MIKKITCFLLTLVLFNTTGQAQHSSCCTMTPTAGFAMLAKEEAFLASHPDPLPFEYLSSRGKMILLKTGSGSAANAFEIKAEKPTRNYLLVIHEWWGLNDYMKQEAEKLQQELGNVNVLALDLYDGKVATKADEAAQLMKAANEKRIVAIVKAGLAYAGKDAHIETIGWCFGGGWSLQASILAGNQGTGCVMYYGMPEQDTAKIRTLKAPVLGIFASKDEWITPEKVNDFVTLMKKNGKDVQVQTFTADHAFANPSNPSYNMGAAAEAHRMAVRFLQEHLK